jgi:hypothetical protein
VDTPRPSPRTNRTRRVPHPVLIGHAAGARRVMCGHLQRAPEEGELVRVVVRAVVLNLDTKRGNGSKGMSPRTTAVRAQRRCGRVGRAVQSASRVAPEDSNCFAFRFFVSVGRAWCWTEEGGGFSTFSGPGSGGARRGGAPKGAGWRGVVGVRAFERQPMAAGTSAESTE